MVVKGSSLERSSETAKRRQREERQKQQKGRNAQAFARMRPEPESGVGKEALTPAIEVTKAHKPKLPFPSGIAYRAA